MSRILAKSFGHIQTYTYTHIQSWRKETYCSDTNVNKSTKDQVGVYELYLGGIKPREDRFFGFDYGPCTSSSPRLPCTSRLRVVSGLATRVAPLSSRVYSPSRG